MSDLRNTIPTRRLAKFLKDKKLKCPTCSGPLSGVLFRPTPNFMEPADAAMNRIDPSRIMISAVGTPRDFWNPDELPTRFFVVPTICDNCGNVQQFSLGAVNRYTEDGDDE